MTHPRHALVRFRRYFLLALLGLPLAACTPAPKPAPGPAPAPRYVVRITTGDREAVSVDWVILPEEGWPLKGNRDRTPFATTLPPGRVAAVFRLPAGQTGLELAVLRLAPDGSLQRVASAKGTNVGVVVIEPGRDPAIQIVGPEVQATYSP